MVSAVVAALVLAACGGPAPSDGMGSPPGAAGQESPDPAADSETAVRSVVEAFGRQLQHVPLLAPEDQVRRAIEDHYAPYVTPDLLAGWQSDPGSAPGRAVSSPWPDRIEIESVVLMPDGAYRVDGRIIEITSVEQGTDEAAAIRPVTLVVRPVGDRWLIDQVTLGDYQETGQVAFTSPAYGFRLVLPSGWEGYRVVNGAWEGRAIEDDPGESVQAGDAAARGPLLRVRHPQWTAGRPRQDIPIMVFTLQQWEDLHAGRFAVGAAPVPPTELARNNAFVLALPARYNYQFPEGHEEVEAILSGAPLEAIDVTANQAAAAAILADLTGPAAPAGALLEQEDQVVADWFTALEAWMQEVVLIPNALGAQGAAADAGVREQVRGALLAYFGEEYVDGILDALWVPDGGGTHRLLETEGPAILPFMSSVELVSASTSQVVIHAATPPPALWEDVTRTYRLTWLEGEDSFRVETIDTEGR